MENILVPTDFSNIAENAVRYAIKFAQATHRKIIFLNVTHADILTSTPHDIYVKKVNDCIANAKSRLIGEIDDIYTKIGIEMNDRHVSFEVLFGHNAQEKIAECAEKYQVSMIIMGTLGASGLKKIFVGSNTAGVFGKVSCPVLAIPEKAVFKEIKKIAFASNFEKLSEELHVLLPYVKKFGAHLDIFHVYPVFPSKLDYSNLNLSEMIKSLKHEFNYSHLELHLVHRAKENELEEGVESFVKTHKPDLLMMVSYQRSWLSKILNPSATKSVALNPSIPLISFKVKS